ncbi:hypothetical protein ACFX5K_04375 [Rickettsiales bacterium LUAb2]
MSNNLLNLNITEYINNNTDKYFISTKKIISHFGDTRVVYAYFLRQNSLYAPYFVLEFLNAVKKQLNLDIILHEIYKEGDFIAAKDPIFFIEGSFADLSELETLILQKVGWPGVPAYNAYEMSKALRGASFISMGARHYSGPEMSNIIDYGISIGSKKAKAEGAKGFLGSSTKEGSKFFGVGEGLGTMPHSLIGYAGSTLKAAQMYHEEFNQDKLVVLIDYFGKEIHDTLEVCDYFKDLAVAGNLSVRIDTNGARYLEGLNAKESENIIKKYVKNFRMESLTEEEHRYLLGKGVSAAAIFKMREVLDNNGFNNVKIIASSDFNLAKCKLMGKIKAPINIVGTGSVITESSQTNATADIISYDGKLRVKKGRENLIEYWKNFKNSK